MRGFGLPQGILGKVGGRIMGSTNGSAQREVAALLDVRPGERVLEVGYGPGTLLRLLADRSEADLIAGVDPSAVMRDQALRRCSAAVTGGRVSLGIGSADDTGYPDQSFDRVVSVNTVVFWEDLDAGLRELHRVLRPGGTLLVAFHSRSSSAWQERVLGLPDDEAARIESRIADVFGGVQRRDLERVVTFSASR